MRILHILGVGRLPRDPEAEPMPGVSKVAMQLARVQAASGHDVGVMANDAHGWVSSWRGVRLEGVGVAHWARLRAGRKHYDLSKWLPLAIRTLRQRFDIIHAHEMVRFSPLFGRVRIAHFHTDPLWDDTAAALQAQLPDFRRISRSTRAQIAVSGFVSRRLRHGMDAAGVGHHADRIRVIPNGVDLAAFATSRLRNERNRYRHEWRVRDEDVVLLFAGAIVPEKGFDVLARAFVNLLDSAPQVRLVVAGGADLWGRGRRTLHGPRTAFESDVRRILEQATEHQRVKWLGVVPGDEIPAIHAACDVLIQPSMFQEAFGLSILEGMAAGNPVVATAVGGVPELVTKDNGIIVPPGDIPALERAIESLVRAPDVREKLSKGALLTAETYTWDAAAEQVLALYEQVLTSAHHGRT
jgi:glycosyltransferase involved in cell wall biosynthesis